MIGILHDSEQEEDASALASALQRAGADRVVQQFGATRPTPWPHELAWNDVLLVLFAKARRPLPTLRVPSHGSIHDAATLEHARKRIAEMSYGRRVPERNALDADLSAST